MKLGTKQGRERRRRGSSALLGLLSLASCGRWGYTWVSPFDDAIPRDSLAADAGGPGSDGGPVQGPSSPGDSDSGGAPAEPLRCAQFGPFAAPELLTGLGQALPFSPALSADGLLLVFGAGAPGDLFLAQRASRSSLEFSPATELRAPATWWSSTVRVTTPTQHSLPTARS